MFPWRRLTPRRGSWLLGLVLLPVLGLSQGIGAATAAGAAPIPGGVQLTTQGAYRFQGWGTSLAWWGNVVGGWQNQGPIEDAIFGRPSRADPDRLGLNVIRYNLGASSVLWCPPAGPATDCAATPSDQRTLPAADASRVPTCRSFGAGRAVPALASGPGAAPDPALDRNQVAVLRAALDRGPRGSFALEAFANSPPWWLTVSGCPQGNRDATDARDNLDPTSNAAYAQYLSDALRAFQQRGISFDTVDPLNEPENPWGQDNNPYTGQPFCTAGCQEGMHFGPEPPIRPTPSLGPLLAQVCQTLGQNGVATRVSAPDGFNPSDTRALVGLTGPVPACQAQINTHMYDFVFPNGLVPYGQGISIYDPTGAAGGRQPLARTAQALSQRLWMSEFGNGGAAGDMTAGLTLSSVIAADMRFLRPAAWVYWQAVEGSGGWGLFEAPSFPQEGPVTMTKRFFALEQYARFIRPGFQILTTLDPLDDPVRETSATMAAVDDLQHPERIVVVGTNAQAAARHVVYDLGSLGVDQAGRTPRSRATAPPARATLSGWAGRRSGGPASPTTSRPGRSLRTSSTWTTESSTPSGTTSCAVRVPSACSPARRITSATSPADPLESALTHLQHDLTIRPIIGSEELDLFRTLTYTVDDELADDLAHGRRRPRWMWVALRGGRLVARAAWWGRRSDMAPLLLDVLDVTDVMDDPDRIDIAVQMLRTALDDIMPVEVRPPEYVRCIPPDWREHAGSRRVVEDRMAIVGRIGARLLVERLRFEWRPGITIAAPTGRVVFRPVEDDGELVDLMTLVMDGTLDAHSREELTRTSAREGAVRHFQDELALYRSPRDWWRVAILPDGEPIGFVTPARNDYGAIIAYLGVLPSYRGNAYSDEILAEGTRILAAQDVPRIRAATDLGNVPMARAFARAGWVNFERAISMTWR
jgi:RimJ/RimL family protein N-acetyltransferase